MKNPFLFDALRHLEMEVQLEAESVIYWNSFPGSALHGALGFTSKKRSCVVKYENCEGCFLLDTCFYSQLFESRTPKDSRRMRKYPHIPPGLRLTIDPWDKPAALAGETLIVGITLFGSAINTMMSLLLSLEETFQRGIGRKSPEGDRGTALIRSISSSGGEYFSWSDFMNFEQIPVKITRWAESGRFLSGSVALNFTSPTRIASGGRVTGSPSFRDIVSTILRRITNIAYFYCGMELEADFKGLLSLAESVEYESNFLRVGQSRYSAHQKRRMTLDGIVGEMRVWDCPEELMPWLELGGRLGIGKNTSMGMGRYVVIDASRGQS